MHHSEDELIYFNALVVKNFTNIFLFLGVGSVLGVILQGLPATVSLKENSPAGTEVFCFKIELSPGISVVSGFPLLLNSKPLTNDLMVCMGNSTHAKDLFIIAFSVGDDLF